MIFYDDVTVIDWKSCIGICVGVGLSRSVSEMISDFVLIEFKIREYCLSVFFRLNWNLYYHWLSPYFTRSLKLNLMHRIAHRWMSSTTIAAYSACEGVPLGLSYIC